MKIAKTCMPQIPQWIKFINSFEHWILETCEHDKAAIEVKYDFMTSFQQFFWLVQGCEAGLAPEEQDQQVAAPELEVAID